MKRYQRIPYIVGTVNVRLKFYGVKWFLAQDEITIVTDRGTFTMPADIEVDIDSNVYIESITSAGGGNLSVCYEGKF